MSLIIYFNLTKPFLKGQTKFLKNTGCNLLPHLFLSTIRNLLFTKSLSPKFCSICLGDPERVPLEEATGENPFEFCQHVAEYQGQLGQVPPAKDHKNCFFQEKKSLVYQAKQNQHLLQFKNDPSMQNSDLGLSFKCFPSIYSIQKWELPARSGFVKTFSTTANSV